MPKLTLQLESLAVESFHVAPAEHDRGTVVGRQRTAPNVSCYDSCIQTACTCYGTCANSCNGTCVEYSCQNSCACSLPTCPPC